MNMGRDRKEAAAKILTHYLSVAFNASGAKWEHDNEVEVREFVYALCEAAVGDTIETLGKSDYIVGEPLYKVVLTDSAEQLGLEVTIAMGAGWRPHGNVTTHTTETRTDAGLAFHDLWWAQPMIKL